MNLDFYPYSDSFDELVELSRRAEDGGFRTIWSAELFRSPFVGLAAVARATDSVRVGTGIAWAFTRSPMSLALTALDLDELSGGRFSLGLGSGVRRLNTDWHDVEFDGPIARMRDTVEIIRRFVASSHLGEPIEVEGSRRKMTIRGYERPFPPVRTAIPIYLASVGPQMTRLTGEIGDGWIGHELGSPEYFADSILPNLDAGLATAGRSRDSLDVVASGICVLHADHHVAMRRSAGVVAFYASVRTYTEFFAYHGFESEALRIQDRFRAGDISGMLDATPDEMVDAVTMSGTRERVAEKLAAYHGMVDAVKLSGPTHLVGMDVTREAQLAILQELGGHGAVEA